ncbi:glycoside hydrolase family 43 protein [Sunxiuqinia rutila]|uniref:glycoside hydrolase family 43 protein n=1 Tax=Sunxiuqinia rutila TaxID=1397841 RepID=UPI003D3601EE
MRISFKILWILVSVISLYCCSFEKSTTPFNPVLPGDNPNPSVVKIGDSYFASATSNEWSPLFPIYKSDDLYDWELVSYVFPGGAPDWGHNNFWAPELSYDEAQQKLFVYYTGREKSTNRITIAVASADTPDGPFTDHGPLLFNDCETIDAFEVRDENENLFLIWKEVYSPGKPAIIYAQSVSEDRKAVTGKKVELIRNDQEWEEHIVEGPCVFRREDYFYLLYSAGNCCDKACNYKIGVARSKSLLGPWEKAAANPILVDNENWKCPGTGNVVTKDQDYYLLYHAYNADGGDYIGREGLLDKIYWTEDNWPYFKTETKVNLENNRIDYFDDFSKALEPCWQWRTTQALSYATGEDGLMLAASSENDLLGSLLAQPVKSKNFEVTATIDLGVSGVGVKGGILLIGATNNGFGAPMAGVGISVGHDLIEVWITSGYEKNVYEAVPTEKYDDLIKLKMNVTNGDLLQFSVSDGEQWDLIADSVDVSAYVPWGMGLRWGLVSKGETNEFVNIRNVQLINR